MIFYFILLPFIIAAFLVEIIEKWYFPVPHEGGIVMAKTILYYLVVTY